MTTLRVVASLGVTAALLHWVVLPRLLGERADLGMPGRGSWWLLVVAVVLEVGSLGCYTALTQTVVPSAARSTWWTQLRMDLTGLAASHVLPGGGMTAAALRYRLMARRSTAATAMTTATVQTAFVDVALLATYCLGVLLAVPEVDERPAFVVGGVLGTLVLGVVVGGAVLMSHSSQRPVRPRPAARSRRQRWTRRAVEQTEALVLQSRRVLRDSDRRTRALSSASGNWVLDAACLWVCLAAYGERTSPGLLLAAYGAANLIALLPLTPGGLGVVEATLATALVGFGVPAGTAVVGILTWRILEFWLPVPVGLGCYLSLVVGERRTNVPPGGGRRPPASPVPGRQGGEAPEHRRTT